MVQPETNSFTLLLAILAPLCLGCGQSPLPAPASPLDVDVSYLLDEGTGNDYVALTDVQRKMFCMVIASVDAGDGSLCNEIFDYFDRTYSDPDQRKLGISEVAADAIADAKFHGNQ